MTVSVVRTQYTNFTGNTVTDQSDTWVATTAERLVIVITSRAYDAGTTRVLTVTWGGTTVPLVGTNFSVPATGKYDARYWVGELASPSSSATLFRVQTDAATRGLNCVGFFVNGTRSLDAARIIDTMDRGALGNTVNLSGTPSIIGSLIVNSTIIAAATTVTSFTPSTWTIVQSGLSGPSNAATSTIRYDTVTSTSALTASTQFGASDVQRGGVLLEIRAETSFVLGMTETVTASDSVGAPIVAVSLGVTEALTATDSSTASIPSNTSPENPVGVWTGAASSWKLPSGIDSKAVNNLTVSGLSAATIKGPGATFTTASYARRTAPNIGSPSNLAVEFWCKPTVFGGLFYLGPRVSGANSVRLWIDSLVAWNLSRTTAAGTQSARSANSAVVLGQTYHVVAVFSAGSNPALYVNGDPVALTVTGAPLSGGFVVGTDDEVAIGQPTLSGIVGFAGDLGRVTLWPIAMSASRVKASYRQQDNLDQWAGISGENASSDTNHAPAAVPVQSALVAGQPSTIDVIARAYDPDGDALSIQSGSLSPSTGAASIVSDRLSWTPASSFTGAATCGFTLRDGGGKSSASKVYATVTSPPPPPPGWPLSGSAADTGDAINLAALCPTTIVVPDDMSLTAALAAATFGTQIRVKPGTYSGTLAFSNNGQGNLTTRVPTAPIYIVAFDPSVDATVNNGVYLSGTLQLHRDFVGVIGRGIRLNKVTVEGRVCRISRCVHRSLSGVVIDMNNNDYRGLRIDRNYIHTLAGPWINGDMNPGHDSYGVRIYRNYLVNHSAPGSSEHLIQVLSSSWQDSHLTVDYNLWDDILDPNPVSGQNEAWSIKVGTAFARYNTIINTGNCSLNLREPTDATILGNWLEAGAKIGVYGDGHTIERNHGEGTGSQILLRSGNAYIRNNIDLPLAQRTPNYGDGECSNASYWSQGNKWQKTTANFKPPSTCVTAKTGCSNIILDRNTARITLGDGGADTSLVRNIDLTGNKFAASRIAAGIDATTINETGTNASLTPAANGLIKLTVPTKNSSDVVGPWSP